MAGLQRFLELPHGIPSHDPFERIRPQAFQACFLDWSQAVQMALRIKHVAIDGKTRAARSRRSWAPCT